MTSLSIYGLFISYIFKVKPLSYIFKVKPLSHRLNIWQYRQQKKKHEAVTPGYTAWSWMEGIIFPSPQIYILTRWRPMKNVHKLPSTPSPQTSGTFQGILARKFSSRFDHVQIGDWMRNNKCLIIIHLHWPNICHSSLLSNACLWYLMPKVIWTANICEFSIQYAKLIFAALWQISWQNGDTVVRGQWPKEVSLKWMSGTTLPLIGKNLLFVLDARGIRANVRLVPVLKTFSPDICSKTANKFTYKMVVHSCKEISTKEG